MKKTLWNEKADMYINLNLNNSKSINELINQ